MANDYLTMTVNAFLAGGIACFLLTSLFSGKTRVGGTVLGYSIVSAGLLLLIIKTQMGEKPQIDALIYVCYPLWLMLVVSGSMITLNLNHTDVISNEGVPPNYFHYSNTVVGLLLVQFYLLLKAPETTSMTKISIAGLALLQLLIIGFILYVILKYYTTDG
jgi:hypothetical protein